MGELTSVWKRDEEVLRGLNYFAASAPKFIDFIKLPRVVSIFF